jgi:hypothetical protein
MLMSFQTISSINYAGTQLEYSYVFYLYKLSYVVIVTLKTNPIGKINSGLRA